MLCTASCRTSPAPASPSPSSRERRVPTSLMVTIRRIATIGSAFPKISNRVGGPGCSARRYRWRGSVDRDRLRRALIDRGPDVVLVLDRNVGDQHLGISVVGECEHLGTERAADAVAAALVVVDEDPHRAR